jgi:hypothetical protein
MKVRVQLQHAILFRVRFKILLCSERVEISLYRPPSLRTHNPEQLARLTKPLEFMHSR